MMASSPVIMSLALPLILGLGPVPARDPPIRSGRVPALGSGVVEQTGYVAAEGALIHYRLWERPDRRHEALLVFVHGGPGGNTVVFRESVGRLLADRAGSLLLIDQRGSGESSYEGVDRASYRFATFIDDMDRVIRYVARGPRSRLRRVLIGHSFGAALAISYIARHPETFDRLVLIAPALSRRDIHVYSYRRMKERALELGDAAKLNEIKLFEAQFPAGDEDGEFLFRQVLSGSEYDYEARRFASSLEQDLHALLSRRHPEPVRPDIGEAFLENEDWRHLDLTPRLDRIDLPTLVLGGASDELTPPPSLEIIHRFLERSRLEFIPGAGHHPYLLDPETFVTTVGRFANPPHRRPGPVSTAGPGDRSATER